MSACEIDSLTDSILLDEPGPRAIIIDCAEHGEVARIPVQVGDTYKFEGERVGMAWDEHVRSAS